jgi:diguanylate cyclase (GGDEF)-like protein/PAS domain S-box-containing protein
VGQGNNIKALLTNFGAYLLAIMVLVTGGSFTYIAWRTVTQNAEARHQTAFSHDAAQITLFVEASFDSYAALVRDGQALFASSDSVSRTQWHAFTHTLDIGHRYAGIQSLAYIPYVHADDLKNYLAHTRRDDAPGFVLTPSGTRDFYCPITYLEPSNVTGDLGFDACSTPKGLKLLMRSRDEGRTLLSPPLGMPDASGRLRTGVIIAGPVYRHGQSLDSVAARQRALKGWVVASMPIDIIMADILRDAPVDMAIYDTSSKSATPIFRSSTTPLGSKRSSASLVNHIKIEGHPWDLQFIDRNSINREPSTVILLGMVITVLVAFIVLNLGRTRLRAIKLARHMTTELRDKEQLLSSITNNISDGIYRSSLESGLIYVNDSLAQMFGYTTGVELMSVPGPILYSDPRRREELQALLEEDFEYHDQEVEYQRKDGSRFFGINSAVAIRGENGEVLYFDGVISDITERKQAEHQVYKLAHYDTLTGLPNRSLLRDRLEQAIADSRRRGEHLAVMFLDLDHFKDVNDSLGHEVGDHLLQAVSHRLLECVRHNDSVSRQGGDEFILVLRDISDSTTAALVADKILKTMGGFYNIGTHELHITPSIGISLFPDDGEQVEDLIRNADTAMYQAKDHGRANYQFFTTEMTRRTHERLSLESELRYALEREELSLFFQPQVDLKTGEIAGAEALLRWNNRNLGVVSPTTFIPVAEQSGLIVPIGEWVLRAVCLQNRAWQDAGLGMIPIAVNLSAIQFRRNDMARIISDILTQSGLDPTMLELELTESVIMQDTRETTEMMRRLNTLGVRLAIDDFGTGYSSLSYLRRFHIDKLKVDQSFVRDITTDPDDAAIISAIINLGRGLNVKVVAEGAETKEQLEFLRRCRCDLIQGYHFSKPLPADAFADLLRDGRKLVLETLEISPDHIDAGA